MNYKKIILLLVLVFSLFSCSEKLITSPADLMGAEGAYKTLSLEEKSKIYPYWNVNLGTFLVVNDTVSGSASADVLYKAKRLEIIEKRLMLQKLDIIRFVMNTKEFEEELLKKKFYSSVNASGARGTIKKGDLYDSKRLLEVLRKRNYAVTIRKGIISAGAAAVGVVGPSLYVMADNNKAVSNSYWIAFPNTEDWSKGGYLQDTYMAGIVLHEMLHNSGFSHTVPNDATYGIQGVFKSVYGDKNFREKYREQLEAFKPFYEKKYENELKSPTVYMSQNKNVNLRINYTKTQTENYDENVCVLYDDGTSILTAH